MEKAVVVDYNALLDVKIFFWSNVCYLLLNLMDIMNNRTNTLFFLAIAALGLPSICFCSADSNKDTTLDKSKTAVTASKDNKQNTPRALVEQVIKDAIALVSSNVTPDQFKKNIKDIVYNTFATESIARFILGSNAKKITAEELQAFMDACTNMMISFYSSKLYEYRNASAEVTKVMEKSESHCVVRTMIAKKNGNVSDKLVVDWSVYIIDGAPRIFDVIIDEISMGQAQRAGISGLIKKKGLKKFLSDFSEENKSLN
ncbi:MAG: ABC transporter substrate-binding protein [Holosporaceae bacterium]|jgi:ABC-type transporter MlaC component|nr:ABC transporter substrate-binding protein [Holosporaceae bacterium]